MSRKSILQSPEWAVFKEKQGFKIHKLGEVFILQRLLPRGFSLAGAEAFFYLPEISWEDFQTLNLNELENLAKERRAIFIKYEFWEEANPVFAEASGGKPACQRLALAGRQTHERELSGMNLISSFEQVQPKWRKWLDVSRSEEEILAQMRPKGRYNIRVAERRGVTVSNYKAPNKELKVFYGLYQETIKREKLKGRSFQYFEDMVDILGESDLILIFIASYKGIPLACALVTFYEGVATYLYGGSARIYKEAMANYLLHFEVIRTAKERGCQLYDLLAVAPKDIPDHPYTGLTRFKDQFGGKTVELMGAYDKILNPRLYSLYKRLEQWRRKQVY